MPHPTRLPKDDFLTVIKLAPLVSVDLVLKNSAGDILMGKRVNEPARGTLFVPGGVIRKGETVASALTRIAEDELGTPLSITEGRLMGVFDHHYDANFAEAPGVTTCYVVIAYEFQLAPEELQLPDDQHSSWEWVAPSNLENVHPNSAAYFEA